MLDFWFVRLTIAKESRFDKTYVDNQEFNVGINKEESSENIFLTTLYM